MTLSTSYNLGPIIQSPKLQWLQGDPKELTKDILVCLLIQPNCPGCLLHAIPTANILSASPAEIFDIYCISTAFEDFEFNTIEAATDLLEGKLVGNSAQTLGPTSTYVIPHLPLALDYIVDKDDAGIELKDMALKAMIKNAREQLRGMKVPEHAIDEVLQNVDHRALPDRIAEVFWTVRAQGTPTWIAHRPNGEVLGVEFGHRNEKELREWIKTLLEMKPTQV